MITATFPAGIDQITVNGLYQWDYGQILEIHSSDLGNKVLEVHFACAKMDEAVVRSVTAVQGVVSAAIPDACIEQAKPIVAWVVLIGETTGKTIKTITLPIIARTRPEPTATIPQSVSDKYTEAIAAMNAAVEAIEDGKVKVGKASYADRAGSATTATNATHASTAGSATTANSASFASKVACNVETVVNAPTSYYLLPETGWKGIYFCTISHAGLTPNEVLTLLITDDTKDCTAVTVNLDGDTPVYYAVRYYAADGNRHIAGYAMKLDTPGFGAADLETVRFIPVVVPEG